MAIVDAERGHGFHDCHDRLQGVAVDDGDELQALFKRVAILVDNSADLKINKLKKRLDCICQFTSQFIRYTFTMISNLLEICKKNDSSKTKIIFFHASFYDGRVQPILC